MLGGWLIDVVGWRAIFLINLPLAAAAVGLALRYVPADRDGRDRPLDGWGAALATAGLGALTWALTSGSSHGGWTPVAVTTAIAALACLAGFVVVEHRRGERAMMPLALFASRTFVGLTLLTVLLYGALGALLVLVPYVLITGARYSGAAAGAALLPLPLVIALTSPLMGGLAGRIGPRLPLALGPLVVTVGFALALRIGPAADYWTQVLPCILVIAIGMSGGGGAADDGGAQRRRRSPHRLRLRLQQRRGTQRRPDRHRACWGRCSPPRVRA